jgi:peptide/nickel transport system substrate-binding protein
MSYVRPKVGRAISAVLLLVLGACSPTVTPAVQPQSQAPQSEPAVQKTLTIAIDREPSDFYGFAGSMVGGGVANVPPIALDGLVVMNGKGEYQPQLAVEQISVERGTWRVNADGTMDTTWKIKPNVKWHDGRPFTAEDMVFTLAVRKDPDTPVRSAGGRLDLVESASAPDPLTFVMHWSAPYVDANQALDLEPLPKHLLEDVYLNQKEAFSNSPYLTTQFIGQGPYRLVEWQSGSHIAFTRFDDYYQGRPPLSRVVVRILNDANTMVANILSGTVDMVLPSGVPLDAAVEVRQRWVGTGNRVHFYPTDGLRVIDSQHRVESARPKDGLTNPVVRQAFYHAIDRKTLSEVITQGIAPVADSWVPPTSAMRPALQSVIPQYPYDLARAQQLLAGAGWVRGPDGVLTNRSTGEKFETELWADAPDGQNIISVVADQWKQTGAQVGEMVIPPARLSDREWVANFPGAILTGGGSYTAYLGARYHSSEVRRAANRWVGLNRSGYTNPRMDSLIDRVAVTINPVDRNTALTELLQTQMNELIFMPLLWSVVPVLEVKGVKSHEAFTSTITWNFFEFDKE